MECRQSVFIGIRKENIYVSIPNLSTNRPVGIFGRPAPSNFLSLAMSHVTMTPEKAHLPPDFLRPHWLPPKTWEPSTQSGSIPVFSSHSERFMISILLIVIKKVGVAAITPFALINSIFVGDQRSGNPATFNFISLVLFPSFDIIIHYRTQIDYKITYLFSNAQILLYETG